MRDFFQLLTDKRFSLRFRILNILSGDYLRNYLALGVLYYVNKCNEIIDTDRDFNENEIKTIRKYLIKAKKGIDDIWKI